MRFSSLMYRSACLGAACLALTGAPAARAQLFRRCPPQCAPAYESPVDILMPRVGEGEPAPRPGPSVDTAADSAPEFAGNRPPAALGESVSMRMLGNQLGIPSPNLGVPATSFIPGGQRNARSGGAVLYPSIRGFRIGEDESPRPEDRVYLAFNYFDDVNAAVNRRIGAPISGINAYRETFGLEKTFLNGDASIGFRLPLDTLDATSPIASLDGNHTDIGDLTVILKYAFWQNRDTGSLASGGLAVTVPTGSSGFAGSHVTSFHDTILQPWVGAIWSLGDFYVHGFSALDLATDSHDVSYWFNDLGVGYFLYKSGGNDRVVTAVVPTLELHLSSALNHQGAFNPRDPAASSDVLDLTAGVTVELNHRSTLAVGFVTPVTGPKPFAWEVFCQFNYTFGGGRSAQGPRSYVLGN